MESQRNQSSDFEFAPRGATVLFNPTSELTIFDEARERRAAAAGLCLVCYNLNPILAPKATTSWAAREYKIPATTPVGEITISDRECLIQAAEDGCFHCSMIKIALETADSEWASKPSIIHIYLALGLPVVVRLQVGYMVSESLDRDSALQKTGYKIPEGSDRLNVSLALYSPEHEMIELEIYRLRQEQDQNAPKTDDLLSLVQYMGFGGAIPLHSGVVDGFDFIKKHLDQCIREHTCEQSDNLPTLPDRILQVGMNRASGIQLHEPKNQRAKYIALSYCWGPLSETTFLTTRHNLKARKAGIDFENLPPLLQDVVACARALGIEFVWVDRLCVLQGDDGDFKTQGPKMGEIYGNATLTIAAASANSEEDRILNARDTRWQQAVMNLDSEGLGRLRLGFRRRSHHLGDESRGGDYGKLSTRAWVWQERLLSSRTVFFTPHAFKFECRNHSVWQGFDQGVVSPSWSAKLDSITNDSWLTLVQEFMQKGITKPSDRLPALNAVMKRISGHTGWKPIWGMWEEAIVQSLRWRSGTNNSDDGHSCQTNPSHHAPSWSWASLEGPISHPGTPSTPRLIDDPFVWELQCQTIDPSSGAMCINAPCAVVNIHVIVQRLGDDKLEEPFKVKYRYRYNLKWAHDREASFYPDVPLMPHSGDANVEFTASVTRVPFGQAIPKESWTGLCLCALLASTKKGAIVMILGQRPGLFYERIGLTVEMHPTCFAECDRQSVWIT